jgi:hypothetical protein
MGVKAWRIKRAALMIWGNCGSNFDHFECIKAELTADMTAISFENHSRHRTL